MAELDRVQRLIAKVSLLSQIVERLEDENEELKKLVSDMKQDGRGHKALDKYIANKIKVGWTHQKIADKLGYERSMVSRRASNMGLYKHNRNGRVAKLENALDLGSSEETH